MVTRVTSPIVQTYRCERLSDQSQPEIREVVGNLGHRRIQVSRHATLEVLQAVQDAHIKTRIDYLPQGTGNQKHDLHRSGGRSNILSDRARVAGWNKPLAAKIQSAVHHQSGNCGEFSYVELAELAQDPRIKAPIFVIGHKPRKDHMNIEVGDRRAPYWGTKDTVIADAHATLSSAHTLELV